MGTRTRYLVFLSLVVLALLVSGCKGRKAIPDLPAEEEMLLLEAEGNTTAAAPTAAVAAPGTSGVTPNPEVAPETEATTQPTESSQPAATEAPSTNEASTPQVEATVESAPAATPVASASGERVHVVQAGQNLFRIALMYGTSVEAIAAANSITNPAMLSVGQELRIPASAEVPEQPVQAGGKTYTVQSGDNLFRIALRYGVDQYYLARYNGIDNPAMIYVGQVIRIP